mmetsp:Transcript_8689/g.21405  ORF Transcript_8689/g.21405 Transcript_8689/m.21405 type:complete len:119 (+) Transcript_8689:500-856(+)
MNPNNTITPPTTAAAMMNIWLLLVPPPPEPPPPDVADGPVVEGEIVGLAVGIDGATVIGQDVGFAVDGAAVFGQDVGFAVGWVEGHEEGPAVGVKVGCAVKGPAFPQQIHSCNVLRTK